MTSFICVSNITTLSLDGDFLHDHRLLGLVHGPGRYTADLHDDVQSLGDFAEHGVAVIQMRRRCQGHEKLAAVGTRTGVGHGEYSRAIVSEVRIELVFKLISRATGTIAERQDQTKTAVRRLAVDCAYSG